MRYHLTADHLTVATTGLPGWRRVALPDDLGPCHVDRLQVDDGIALVYSDYRPRHDIVEESVIDKPVPALTITLGLEGASEYCGSDARVFGFRAGFTTVTAFASSRGQRRYQAEQPVRQLRLVVEAPVLAKFGLESLLASEDGDATRQLFFERSSVAVQQLGQTMLRCHAHPLASPATSRLELQIAALSLLAEQARQLQPVAAAAAPGIRRWRPDDEARLHQARDLVLGQFDKPLTVAWLCAAVGINEFKLKQGFRDLFDTTPHRLLTTVRMQHAWTLLEAGEPVSRVAYRTGFEHPANFSAAFSRFHGRTPKSVAGRARASRAP